MSRPDVTAMNWSAVEKTADALLDEASPQTGGPAASARRRWSVGTLYPPGCSSVRSGSEVSGVHIECLLRSPVAPRLSVRLRFRQMLPHATYAPHDAWDMPLARTVDCELLGLDGGVRGIKFSFPPALGGIVLCTAENLGEVFKIAIDVRNETRTPSPEPVSSLLLRSAMLSAHCLLATPDGEFLSLLDPPAAWSALAGSCRNVGSFPVLVGDSRRRNMLLCAPVVLNDYPQASRATIGSFPDGTEFDEVLARRVLTFPPVGKQLMKKVDDHARRLLKRTHATARKQLQRIHGIIRKAG